MLAIFKPYLINFFKDKQKKPYPVIIKEFIQMYFWLKTFPFIYFSRFVYRKDVKNIYSFVSMELYRKILTNPSLQCQLSNNILDDKIKFNQHVAHKEINTTKLLAYTKNNNLYIDENIYKIHDFNTFVEKVSPIFKDSDYQVFCKPSNGIKGKGCFIISINTITPEIYEAVVNKDYIFEEKIIQHPELMRLNPYSVNTLRIDAYKDKSGKVEVLNAFLRIGVGKKIVDNTAQGGIIVNMNIETGYLEQVGIVKLYNSSTWPVKHPETGVYFGNFKIPFYKEAIDIVKKSSTIFDTNLIGWDIAISEDRALVIEGNHNYSLAGKDTAYRGYLNNPIFQKVLTENGLSEYLKRVKTNV